ncbi:MAG: hypothetical protein HQ485_13100 [Acidobacteria bacterium]|jgi:hypothetical protein|nr:hypothetical protein [Acidobacteriota bacterium]
MTINCYREFARAALRAPAGFPQPTNTWTVAPSFYLRTVIEDTGEPIPTEIVAAIRRVFAKSVPELSGGRLAMAAFETGTEPRPEQEGWVT